MKKCRQCRHNKDVSEFRSERYGQPIITRKCAACRAARAAATEARRERIRHLYKSEPVCSPSPWAMLRVNQACQALGIALHDFLGTGRHPKVVEARNLVAYILHELPGPGGLRIGYTDIAMSMGRANHSTVKDQARRVADSPELQAKAYQLAIAIRAITHSPPGRTDAA